MPENLQAILLAGGKSIRFNTDKTKLTEKICGKEMVMYPIELLTRMNIETTIVVGFQKEKIIDVLNKHNVKNIDVISQEEQFGTGHAVAVTKKIWDKDHILVINGDIPLMTADAIHKLYNKHIKNDADISFLTAHSPDETEDSYCRVIINDNKISVVERRSETLDIESQCCISVGVYIMKKDFLVSHIDKLNKSSLTNEYYLPELIQIASEEKCKIVTSPTAFDLARTVYTIAELWVVEHIKRSQIISYWMANGVRFASSLNVIIDCDVILEPGVFIGLGVHLLGKTIIKKNTSVEAFSYIENSVVEQNCKIKPHTVVVQSIIEQGSTIHSFTQVSHQQATGKTLKTTSSQSPLFTGAVKDDVDMNNLHNL